MQSLPKSRQVKRTVEFFRARRTLVNGQVQEFDPEAILAAIQRCNGSGDIYNRIDDDQDLFITTGRVGSIPALTANVTRRRGLPRVEERGKLWDLDLREDQGLAEQTHIVFFEDRVIGAEYNYYGPRLPRLLQFLQAKCPDIPMFMLMNLVDHDVAAKLASLKTVSMLRLRLLPSQVDILKDMAPDLEAGFKGLLQGAKGESVEFMLRAPGRKGNLAQVKDWLQGLFSSSAPQAETFKIRGTFGDSGRIQPLDLLEGQIASERWVPLAHERQRSVDSEAMFREIVAAREELRESIRKATAVAIDDT